MADQFTSTPVQYYENGTTYTDRNKQTQPFKSAYIVHQPTSKQAQNLIPLVLVQGWTGVKEDWDQLLPYVATQRPVLTFDNRDMGQSSIVATQYTMDDFVSDTHSLIRHVFPNHPAVHLMGISMGGMIVQSYVLAHPTHVQSLIIGCSHSSARHASRTPDSAQFVQMMLGATPTTKEEIIAHVTKVQRFQYTDAWIQQHQQQFQQAVQHSMRYKKPRVGTRGQFAAISQYDVRDKIGSIQTPTLIIHGTGDQVIDYKNAEQSHKTIQHSELLLLPDVGHKFWNMDDGRSGKRIKEFLAKHDRSHSKL